MSFTEKQMEKKHVEIQTSFKLPIKPKQDDREKHRICYFLVWLPIQLHIHLMMFCFSDWHNIIMNFMYLLNIFMFASFCYHFVF